MATKSRAAGQIKYVEREMLTYVDYKGSRKYCTIPQLLYYYDALILGSISSVAFIIMIMHDIVFCIIIAGGDA